MDEKSRECQDDESFDDCVTTNYMKNVNEKCRCSPFNLRISDEV